MDDGNSSLRTMDIYILRNKEDWICYENAILMQDWTSQCSFLTRELNDGTVAVQGVTEFTHILANSTKLQELNLTNTRVYIDNSPFPNGIVSNYEPLTVYVMKENIYSTSSTLTTVSYSLILIFAMICAVITGQSFKYHRVRMQFKRDQEGFKNAYEVANGTTGAASFSGSRPPISSETRLRTTSNEEAASLLSNSRDHLLINQTIGARSNKDTFYHYRPKNSHVADDDSDDDSNIPAVPIISTVSHQ